MVDVTRFSDGSWVTKCCGVYGDNDEDPEDYCRCTPEARPDRAELDKRLDAHAKKNRKRAKR